MLEGKIIQKANLFFPGQRSALWNRRCWGQTEVQVSKKRGDRKEYQSHCNTINANHKHLCLHHNHICFLPWRKGLGSRFWIPSLVVIIWFCPGTGATHIYWLQQDQSQSSVWSNKQIGREKGIRNFIFKPQAVNSVWKSRSTNPPIWPQLTLIPSATLLMKKVPAKTRHFHTNQLNGLFILPFFF